MASVVGSGSGQVDDEPRSSDPLHLDDEFSEHVIVLPHLPEPTARVVREPPRAERPGEARPEDPERPSLGPDRDAEGRGDELATAERLHLREQLRLVAYHVRP